MAKVRSRLLVLIHEGCSARLKAYVGSRSGSASGERDHRTPEPAPLSLFWRGAHYDTLLDEDADSSSSDAEPPSCKFHCYPKRTVRAQPSLLINQAFVS